MPGDRPERQTDDDGGDQGCDDGEHQDRRGVLENAPNFAGERRLEDEQRQEDVDERLGAQRQVGEQLDDVADAGRERAVHQNARSRADRRADHGEEHDRRQSQPLRQRLAEGHDHQQTREYGQNDDDIDHLFKSAPALARPGFGALRIFGFRICLSMMARPGGALVTRSPRLAQAFDQRRRVQ